MKNLFITLFFFSTLCVNAQSDTLVSSKRSVIALDKVKTIYRGISNPISIAVSNCKSFTVKGVGVEEVSEGKYIIIPGKGNDTKIVVTITNFDDSIRLKNMYLK